MGVNDAREQLEVAKAEVVRLEAAYENLARLHEVATERTVQLAAVIETARVALDGMDVYQYEVDSTYIHDVRKALDSDTSALREVRAKAWDEGFTEGHHTPSERENGDINCDCRKNPYREGA